MRFLLLLIGLAFGALIYTATAEDSNDAYSWDLPKGFPRPHVPADNPMTKAKVELGRYLFYDTRMSVNGKESCASCHNRNLRLPMAAPSVSAPRENCIRAAL